MTGSSNDVTLGKHLETFANNTKQYFLTELLVLINALNSELDNAPFSDSDLDYIFTDLSYSQFSNSDLNYIFSEQEEGNITFSDDQLSFIFSNHASAPNSLSSSELHYIFS